MGFCRMCHQQHYSQPIKPQKWISNIHKSAYCRLRECNDLVFVRNGILREFQVTSRSVKLLNRSLNPVLLACLLAGCRTPPLLYFNDIFVSSCYWSIVGPLLSCIWIIFLYQMCIVDLLATGRTRVWVAFCQRGVKQDQSENLNWASSWCQKKYFKTDMRREIQKR